MVISRCSNACRFCADNDADIDDGMNTVRFVGKGLCVEQVPSC